jgi:hypothetical protein
MNEFCNIRKVAMIISLLLCIMPGPLVVHAELQLNLDFRQDGTYESSWPLKAGEPVSLDIYVSNVPTPGLGAMGFKMVYDSSKLQVVQTGTGVDTGNWSGPFLDLGTPGEIHMAGFRMGSPLSEDNVKLGSVRFQSTQTGASELRLLDRGETVDCFVLADDPENPTVLDEEFADGIFLVTQIRLPIPGDVNGDEVVDLADGIVAFKMMVQMSADNVHSNADVNGDNKIGLAETIYILQTIAGQR